MLKSLNVATPFAAATISLPCRLAFCNGLPSVPMAIVTVPAKSVAMLPNASMAVACTGGVVDGSYCAVLGWARKSHWGAGAGAPGGGFPGQVLPGKVASPAWVAVG